MNSEKRRILIIDDEPDVLEFLSYNFRRQGYEVVGAANGFEGLKIIKAFEPQLIIADIMMPGMSGIALGELLRGDEKYKGVPLIFLSAIQDDYGAIQAGTLWDEFVSKPIKFRFLLALVEKHLRVGKTSH